MNRSRASIPEFTVLPPALFFRMPERNIEVGNAGAGIPGCLGILEEPFEKEDMSEMFRRAFFRDLEEKPAKPIYKCYVCGEKIKGRVITAMTQKFHPECFVCTYCRKEFKDRTFKSDPVENRPYCKLCYEKLLGHFGSAHGDGPVLGCVNTPPMGPCVYGTDLTKYAAV